MRPTSTILRSTDEDRAHHAEIDREEHPDRDQRDFRGLENAEPQDEQRHPGDATGSRAAPARSDRAAGAPDPNSRRWRRARCRRPRQGRSRRRRGVSVATMWRASSPLRASSTMVANSLVGGGTSRPLDQPSQTMISQPSASANRQQQSERRPRVAAQRADGARGAHVVGFVPARAVQRSWP